MAVFQEVSNGKGVSFNSEKTALVQTYTPYVRSIAFKIKKTLPSEIELDDLMSYGMTGLLEASERFDPTRGANFITFSYYRVRGAIYDGLRGMGWVNRSEYQKIRFLEKANAYLENHGGREKIESSSPSGEHSEMERLVQKMGHMVTIFVTSLEGSGSEDIADEAELPDGKAETKQLLSMTKAAIKHLPDQYQKLIELYYFKGLTLEQVGKTMGISKSWTCRLHAQAIEKLTQMLKKAME